MHMYANDATLHLGVSSVRPLLPDLLDFVARTASPPRRSPLVADWEDAPAAYPAPPKLVLHRAPLDLSEGARGERTPGGLDSLPMTTNPEAAPADTGEYTHRQILTILSGLMLGMFLGALDQTIVSTSIRTIADDLQG